MISVLKGRFISGMGTNYSEFRWVIIAQEKILGTIMKLEKLE